MGRTYVAVDPSKDSTFYIWEVRFAISVRQLDVTTTDYINQLGFIDSGDPGINREIANEIITLKVPISEMVDYYRKGISFSVVNKEDTVVIYEYVQNHLEKFANKASQHTLNRNSLPLDDLLLMEEFADRIYAHSKYREKKVSFKGLYTDLYNQMGFGELLDPQHTVLTSTQIAEENDAKKRESFAESFKRKQQTVADLWK